MNTRDTFQLTTATAIERVRQRNATLHAFVTTRLVEAAAESSAREREPARTPLHAVPFSLKDEWDTAGIATTGGSYRHRHRVPTQNSPVFDVFSEAGAILIGKTNLSDLGLSPEASSYVGGSVLNPFDLTRTAGGSSGGAAAAVADGMVAFDWGTDIGGSIRLPSAFCGILGMKLSSETWPITRLFPSVPHGLNWMCGQGPLTRTIGEMRAILDVASPRLRTGPVRSFSLRGVVLHVPDRLGKWPTFTTDVVPHLRSAFGLDPGAGPVLPSTTRIRKIFDAIWASHFEDILACDPTISLWEGLRAVLSSVVFRGIFGDRRFHSATAELLALIALGRFTIYRSRAKALRDAELFRSDTASLWDRGFLIVSPVCAFPPPRLGRLNWSSQFLASTVAGNLADATALSIPFGTFDGRLPRGLQILGPPGSEALLLDLGERLIESRNADPALRLMA